MANEYATLKMNSSYCELLSIPCQVANLELVSKELNQLAAILHVYAGGLIFYEVKEIFFVIIFQKENGNTFTLLIIFIVKSLQKEQNSTNLLL